jgi:mono/diheme cytochrome c family protein
MQARRPLAAAPPLALALAALLASAGCRNEMYDQPKYEALELNSYFDDGASARPLVAGTVGRLDLKGEPTDQLYSSGRLDDGAFTDELPFAVTAADLERGQQRYRIYCKPCHGLIGDGNGMIVQRGFSPPPSFHSAEIRSKSLGHYFDVITNGHGAMYSYAARINPRDRWLIASYLRALQLSQDAPVDQLSAEDRRALAAAEADANARPQPNPSAEGREAQP